MYFLGNFDTLHFQELDRLEIYYPNLPGYKTSNLSQVRTSKRLLSTYVLLALLKILKNKKSSQAFAGRVRKRGPYLYPNLYQTVKPNTKGTEKDYVHGKEKGVRTWKGVFFGLVQIWVQKRTPFHVRTFGFFELFTVKRQVFGTRVRGTAHYFPTDTAWRPDFAHEKGQSLHRVDHETKMTTS